MVASLRVHHGLSRHSFACCKQQKLSMPFPVLRVSSVLKWNGKLLNHFEGKCERGFCQLIVP